MSVFTKFDPEIELVTCIIVLLKLSTERKIISLHAS